ncbi:MAG: hypothetical protein ACLT1J_10415 [Mediterraneibacter gnavus]
MIQYETIKQAMGVDVAVSRRMAQAIYRWSKMYINESPWLNDDVKGLNLPATICSEMCKTGDNGIQYQYYGRKQS